MEVSKHICNYVHTDKYKIIFDEYPILNQNDTTFNKKYYKIYLSNIKKEKIKYFIYD